ncbi:copper chaperone PCu(A)C [Ancylobacter terrae]|uniref:copper chaperone PCu(A)C n=1 Tax=Ancylobacter sp. sgz301288 TaxID=3342077 RepID=UPI0038599976
MLSLFKTRLLPHAVDRLGAGLVASALLAFSFSAVTAHEFKAGEIEVAHPWSRVTPAGASVAGGYFTLENEGKVDDRLLGAAAEIAGKTEIHEMSVKDGVMTMRPLPDGVAVPAGAKVAFAPGGYHLMFLGIKAPLKEGESFKGSLTFEKAGTVEVSFKVEGMAGPKGAAAPGAADPHAQHSTH